MRFIYRIRQTWSALTAKPDRTDLEEVQEFLPPDQFSLFNQLHPSEQSHSIAVFRLLRQNGINQPDLLNAALLHDIGKIRYPLYLWERIIIVLGTKITPRLYARWSDGEPCGWKRPFVVSQKHAEWGARMAADAGASPLTVDLISRHQQEVKSEGFLFELGQNNLESSELSEEQLLSLLQLYDNNY